MNYRKILRKKYRSLSIDIPDNIFRSNSPLSEQNKCVPSCNDLSICKVEKYSLMKTLSHGYFSKVSLVTNEYKNRYILKQIFKYNHPKNIREPVLLNCNMGINLFLNEIKLQNRAKDFSPKIYKSWICNHDGKSTGYILMEYIESQTLYHIIKKNKIKYIDILGHELISKIILNIKKINKLNICHFDCHPKNILITRHKNVYIIDYGLSKETNKKIDIDINSFLTYLEKICY